MEEIFGNFGILLKSQKKLSFFSRFFIVVVVEDGGDVRADVATGCDNVVDEPEESVSAFVRAADEDRDEEEKSFPVVDCSSFDCAFVFDNVIDVFEELTGACVTSDSIADCCGLGDRWFGGFGGFTLDLSPFISVPISSSFSGTDGWSKDRPSIPRVN